MQPLINEWGCLGNFSRTKFVWFLLCCKIQSMFECDMCKFECIVYVNMRKSKKKNDFFPKQFCEIFLFYAAGNTKLALCERKRRKIFGFRNYGSNLYCPLPLLTCARASAISFLMQTHWRDFLCLVTGQVQIWFRENTVS